MYKHDVPFRAQSGGPTGNEAAARLGMGRFSRRLIVFYCSSCGRTKAGNKVVLGKYLAWTLGAVIETIYITHVMKVLARTER